jgi:hypothetical protein
MRLAVPGRVHHHCGYSYLDARGDAELRWAHQRRFGHAVRIVLLQRQPRSAVGARAPRRHEDQGLAALVAPDASRLLTSGSPASSRTLMAPMYYRAANRAWYAPRRRPNQSSDLAIRRNLDHCCDHQPRE